MSKDFMVSNFEMDRLLPLDTVWMGSVFTTKGLVGHSQSILKDRYTTAEWGESYHETLCKISDRDSKHHYIGGLMVSGMYYILICLDTNYMMPLAEMVRDMLPDTGP